MVRMMEFKVLNMNRFLSAVNSCTGAVYLVDSEGMQENINQNPGAQRRLIRRHKENHSYLKIVISIPEQRDYITLVNCFAEECFQFFCGSFFYEDTYGILSVLEEIKWHVRFKLLLLAWENEQRFTRKRH